LTEMCVVLFELFFVLASKMAENRDRKVYKRLDFPKDTITAMKASSAAFEREFKLGMIHLVGFYRRLNNGFLHVKVNLYRSNYSIF